MEIDLLDPAAYRFGQPYEQLLWLQKNDPVHWHHERTGGSGFFALTRYADIRFVQGNPAMFTSFPTSMVPDEYVYGDEDHHLLMHVDPPLHTVRRRLLGKELMPTSVREMTGTLRAIAAEIVDDVIERGSCDLVSDIAGALASYVSAELLGIPREDAVEMYELADRSINAESQISGDGLECNLRLGEYAARLWDEKRQSSGDMLARVATTPVENWPNDGAQFALDFLLMFDASGDTTRNVLAGGMDALFARREQWNELTADPALVPSAVEEMLRWVTPVVYQRRTAVDDVVVGGMKIKAGQKLASFFWAANADGDVFEDPLEFDIHRRPNNHMAFGFGPHHCLGSHLARLELQIMLEELVTRVPDLDRDGETSWERKDYRSSLAPVVVGPQVMPVRVKV